MVVRMGIGVIQIYFLSTARAILRLQQGW